MTAQTLPQYFNELLLTLTIDDELERRINETHRRVVTAVQKRWKNVQPFYSGSYGRKSKIAPINDVDLFLVLDEECKEIAAIRHQPDALLEELAKILTEDGIATEAQLRMQRRSLGLLLPEVRFDLVPALRRKGGGFYIMDREALSRGAASWLFTDPKKHERFTKEKCQANSQALPLIKLVKRCVRVRKIAIKSFHLEVMVLRAIDGSPKPAGYAEGLAALFEKLAHAVGRPCGDPGESGHKIDDYLQQAERDDAAQFFREAWTEMKQALTEAKRVPAGALQRVRALFEEAKVAEIEALRRLALPFAPLGPAMGAPPPPERTTVLLDADILRAAAGPMGSQKSAALRLLERALLDQIKVAVLAGTFVEVFESLKGNTTTAQAEKECYELFRKLPLEIWPLDDAALDAMLALRVSHPALSRGAALLVATALQKGVGLCSYNPALQDVPNLARYEP